VKVEEKIRALGLELPVQATPAANYVSAVRTGNLLFVSGHGTLVIDGVRQFVGKVGSDLTMEQGYEAAKQVCLNCLSTIKTNTGDLDKVTRVVKLLGMVNGAPDFDQHPKVINGASDLLVEIFGERGRHARSAVGMGNLPFGMAVEIEMIVEVED
jgi:enamine deaminase RidA (YjgF/YER057c/UK114 family)